MHWINVNGLNLRHSRKKYVEFEALESLLSKFFLYFTINPHILNMIVKIMLLKNKCESKTLQIEVSNFGLKSSIYCCQFTPKKKKKGK